MDSAEVNVVQAQGDQALVNDGNEVAMTVLVATSLIKNELLPLTPQVDERLLSEPTANYYFYLYSDYCYYYKCRLILHCDFRRYYCYVLWNIILLWDDYPKLTIASYLCKWAVDLLVGDWR